jgi:transposase-like protein
MARIVPGIHSPEQHLEHLRSDPEAYRPECCPHCGRAGVWRHGSYERKTPPGEGLAYTLGELRIPRFLCPRCERSCSRLPMGLAPLRHFLWKVQQVVLEGLIAGESIRQVSRRVWPSRRTISRWWQWLGRKFESHAFHLCSRFPELGRGVDMKPFWQGCLAQMGLGEAMSWLEQAGVAIP